MSKEDPDASDPADDLMRRSMCWIGRVHLNAIDAKIHLPFVLRLVDFFVRPLQQEPMSLMVPMLTLTITLTLTRRCSRSRCR